MTDIVHTFIELCKQYHYHGSWPTEFNSVCEELAELVCIGTVSMNDIPPDNALTAGYILRCRGDITNASRFMAYAFMTSEEARNTDIFNDYRKQATSMWGNTVDLLELVTKKDNQEKVEYFLCVLSATILSKDISAPTPETPPETTPETPPSMNVQVISAEWCKRCHVIKPEVAKVCALTQIPYAVLDFDELDEADKLTVKSLPTIRILRGGVVDSTYTASEFEAWKSVLMAAASGTKDEDF